MPDFANFLARIERLDDVECDVGELFRLMWSIGQMAARAAKSRAHEFPIQDVFVACDAVSRDPGTMKASLYGLFGAINLENLEQAANFSLYLRFQGGKGQFQLVFQIIQPDSKSLAGVPDPHTVELSAKGNTEIHAMIGGLKFKKFNGPLAG